VLGAAVACAGASALPGLAAVVENRTVRVSGPAGGVADGESANPAISSTGRLVAFDSSATNITPDDGNGAVRDVFTYDRQTGERLLVSRAPGGEPADGPSLDPALAGPSRRVAFTSAATNLVPGDTNGKADVFVREGAGEIVRVSVAYDGSEANGDSYQPDISADGRYVVFTSTASNLVPGDTNGVEDVFIRDLVAGTTRRVSVRGRAGQANGRSGTPAISPDGRFVTFESEATNLHGRDRNRVADVFLRDVRANRTVRVSNAWNGRQQNRAVAAPFRMVSDVSRGGRYVVFESDATNLVPGDTNRDTDVFLVDRRKKTIERISVSTRGLQGDNDSFAPTITPDGRFVAFQSFASNLAPNGAAREDIFVHDRHRGVTVLGSVSATGTARGPERARQLLQQPALSDNGTVVAFISGADNLTPGDTNGLVDVFVRDLTPPHGTLAGPAPRAIGPKAATVEVEGDDPQAGRAVCRLDGGPPRECGYPQVRLPRNLADGPHRLAIHVGGPGMLFDPTPIRLRYTVDRSRPGVVLDRPATPMLSSLTTISGRAGDRVSGVERVLVAVVASRNTRTCRVYDGRRFVKARSCKARRYVEATGARRWRLRLRQRPHGLVFIEARAVDRAGNVSPPDRRLVFVR
jgi:Tol biopolymer transport system component